MRVRAKKIDIGTALVIYPYGITEIQYVVVSSLGEILDMSSSPNTSGHLPTIRRNAIEKMSELISKYNVTSIILEENKLFTDSITKYPDPYLLRNVLLGFGIQVSIEDKYLGNIPNIFILPSIEWRDTVLGKNTRSAIDRCKTHVMQQLRRYSEKDLLYIDKHQNYEALCLSESVIHKNLIHKKYLLKE